MTLLLDSIILDIPSAFPKELQNGVHLLSFAKGELCYDLDLHDVCRTWVEFDETEDWIAKGMPNERKGEHVIPDATQIEAYRLNTLNTIYFSSDVRDLYAFCIDSVEATSLAEAIDKAAVLISVSSGVRGNDGQDYFLRADDGILGFYNSQNIKADPETIAQGMRAVVSVATHFSKAAQFFNPDNGKFNSADFERHMPVTLRTMFSLPAVPVIAKETVPATYSEFITHLFGPMFRDAAAKETDVGRTERGVGRYLEIIKLSQQGAVPYQAFAEDFIPKL